MSVYLTIADLEKVYNATTFAAQTKWQNILQFLDMSPDVIVTIGTDCLDPEDCYRAGLKQWLQGGKGSWEDLAKALSRTIERDHVLSTEASTPMDVKSEKSEGKH